MAKKKEPTEETPVEPVNPDVDPTPIEDKLAQVAEDQKKSQDAYRDSGPAEPSL